MNNNYNNIYCDYIGALGSYSITDYVDNTSNILHNEIIYTSNVLHNEIIYTSNVLNLKIDYTSNILNTKIDYTSNILDSKYSKLINEKIIDNIINTYIYSSNTLGEIRFVTKGTPIYALNNNNNYIIKIKENGRLAIYYDYDIAYPTVFRGWYDIMDGVRDAYAYQATNGFLISDILTAINTINSHIIGIESALGSLATNVELLNGTTVEGLNAIITDAIANGYGDIFNNTTILGITGFTVVGLVATISDGIVYEQYINAQLKELLKLNNSNVTQTQKDGLIQQLKTAAIDNLYRINSNLRNLNTENGFVNSNISSTQFINNLKVNTLDANFGVINNINNIQTNEIIVSGRIQQNNQYLDNTFLTSNHIYNLSYNYTPERQYPPKNFTTSSSEKTVTFLSNQVYNQTMFLDTNNISYGNGAYEVYSSSTYDNGLTNKDKLFNYDIATTTNTPRWSINLYNSGTGNYQGNNSIDGVYYGDWIVLKIPQEILLTKFRIYKNTAFTNRSPSLFKVFGSKDGINFNEIPQAHQFTRLTTSNYTSGYYEKVLSVGHTTLYNYIGFVFSALVSTSGETTLDFSELQIFGKEVIGNNIISTIYATSNDVINIAQQQPTYFKKLNITIPNSRFSYDGINALFYYDLNIQQYIPYSTYGAFKYRNFRISTFVENTDWLGGRNLKDISGNYYNNPEPLTLYCNNAQNISGIMTPNDSYHNCIILGKSLNTNLGNWSAVNNNFNYIRYLTKIGWDIQIILEMLN